MNYVEKVEEFKFEKPEINYQARFLTVCPLAPRANKVRQLNKDGKVRKVYETEFVKKMGNTELIIVGRKKFGVPHGRDILVVLFLIREALTQNNGGLIVTKSPIRKYLDTFGIDKSEKGYSEAKKRFTRIRYSHWYWDEHGKNIDKENSESYQIIKRWSVFFDKKDLHQLFDSYIELDSDFWKYIKNKRIPYDLNMVRKIKNRPIILNLYLLLVYRTYEIWDKHPNKHIYIPFFGENGLMYQLSANFKQKRDFKVRLINKWLPVIKSEWPNCPCLVEQLERPRNNKRFKDGLTICVNSPSQLHIAPHWPKRLRQAREEAAKESEKTKRG